jgi:hypothetical protein
MCKDTPVPGRGATRAGSFRGSASASQTRGSGSAEGGDGVLFFAEDLEKRQKATHGEGLEDDFGRIDELDRSSSFFGDLQSFHEEADAAGIEFVDVSEAEDDLNFAVGGEVFEGLAEAVEGRAKDESSMEGDRGDSAMLEDTDFE